MNWNIILCWPKRNKKALTTIILTTLAVTIPAMAHPDRPNEYGLVGKYPTPGAKDGGPCAVPVIE